MAKRETEERTSGGVKRKRDEGGREKEVHKSEAQSGAEALQYHGSVREGEKEECGGVKTQGAEEEKDRKETKRQTRSRRKVRKEKEDKSNGAKRKAEGETRGRKKAKIDLKKGRRTEEGREHAGGEGKRLQEKEESEEEETVKTEEEKKRVVKKKEGDEKSKGEEKEHESASEEVNLYFLEHSAPNRPGVKAAHVSAQRQHHLAARRERLLTSLQGLLKSGGKKAR